MSVQDLLSSFEKLNLKPITDSDSKSNIENNLEVNLENLESNLNLGNLESNLNLNIIENLTMSQFKPEYLNCVPQFDGNASELNRYLATCKSLIDNFYDQTQPNLFQNIYLLNCLIGKLTGNARLVVNVQNVKTWDELKDTLYRNFADRRDETCLNRDLVMLKQNPNESPQSFYDRCLEILNLICSYVDAHETSLSANTKRVLYQKLALKTFLSGLKEPLGNTVRCMRPKDLTEAIQFVIEENNTKYFQNHSINYNTKPISKPPQANNSNFSNNSFNRNMPNHNFGQPNFNFQHRPNFSMQPRPNFNQQQRPNFPSQPIPIRPNPNYRPPQFFTNSQVFGKQNQNVFKPDPSTSLPKPTPMSISTRQSHKPSVPGPYQPNYFRPTGPRNFISEELFNTELNNETDLSNEYYDPNQYDENYYCENFNENIDNNYTEEQNESENFSQTPQSQTET